MLKLQRKEFPLPRFQPLLLPDPTNVTFVLTLTKAAAVVCLFASTNIISIFRKPEQPRYTKANRLKQRKEKKQRTNVFGDRKSLRKGSGGSVCAQKRRRVTELLCLRKCNLIQPTILPAYDRPESYGCIQGEVLY